MGQVFLRAYPSVYDLENKRIGLIGEAISVTGALPSDEEGLLDNYLFIGMLIAVLAILCICIICCILTAFKGRRSDSYKESEVDVVPEDEQDGKGIDEDKEAESQNTSKPIIRIVGQELKNEEDQTLIAKPE